MEINSANSSLSYSSVSAAQQSSASSLLQSSSELTEEEKEYDLDGDGVLSATERAAMQQAQQLAKLAETQAENRTPPLEDKAVLMEQMQSEAEFNQSVLLIQPFETEE